MNWQPTLKNDLVTLRPVEEKDLEPLYEVARDPMIWSQHRFKRYIRSEFEAFFDDMIAAKSSFIILDQANGQFIGSSGYKIINGFEDGIEIGGTFFSRNYWGGPYNRTVKKMMIDHALHYVEYVLFHVHMTNIRSQKAVEKLNGRKISPSEFTDIPAKSNEHIRYLICKDCGPELPEMIHSPGHSYMAGPRTTK
ncbi:GNAT family N-acetyltransferase [Membranicola marinus]|uniref:GNAT family N-acetyltransferase n=1 Tax=Membranihabitans marinus TaxID=1227546 RepID=A0A953HSF8_9BACT|nr:GNAT family N-acetyltransferase [Membranihabitans marinus]MBY5960098.1 GNAT family N-acetyltransferase [Membranihabitans marinus]